MLKIALVTSTALIAGSTLVAQPAKAAQQWCAVMNLGDLAAKFKAFDWEVIHLENGNDVDEVATTLEHAKTFVGKGKPIVILMKTSMGKGVDFMEGSHEWHGIAPNDEQLQKALAQLPETLGDY